MKTKVFWTKDEQRLVAEAYLQERDAGKRKHVAMKAAQELLPSHRRRPMNTSSGTTLMLKLFEKAGLLNAKPKLAAPAVAQVALAPVAPPPTDGIAASIRAVALEVAEQVAAAVFEEIKSRLRTLATEFVRQEGRLRPKVLVVGPIPSQQNRLRSECGELLDLRFVASDEPARRIREIAPTCARVYLWTNYINHTHQEAAKSVAIDRIQFVSGGVDTLVKTLTEFAVQT